MFESQIKALLLFERERAKSGPKSKYANMVSLHWLDDSNFDGSDENDI